jgi:hypothetical protein
MIVVNVINADRVVVANMAISRACECMPQFIVDIEG